MTTIVTNPPKKPLFDTDQAVVGKETVIEQKGNLPQQLLDDPQLIQRVEFQDATTSALELQRFLNEFVEILVYEPQVIGNMQEQWYIPLSVDGVSQYVRRGIPQKIRRKFVEVLARARKAGVHATGYLNGRKEVVNEVRKTSRALEFPFQVISDPSGAKGAEWLAKILREDR